LGVANFATLGTSGIDDRREVRDSPHETGNLVRNARCGRGANDAGQRRSHVDLVRHHLEIQSVARGRIHVLRLVAQDALLNSEGVSTLKDQLVMTGVAARGADDIARHGDRRAVGNKVKGGAGGVRAQVE